MDTREAVQRMLAMGFQDVTARYNAENQAGFAHVFFHPHEGPHGLWCYGGEDQDIFSILRFLEGKLSSKQFSGLP
jgi:hypothetical protein